MNQPQAQSPLVQQAQPVAQQAQPFQPPAAQWPQQGPDMAYAQQLAQYYGNQLPNQQVPGSAPLPAMGQPQQAQPVAQQPLPNMGQSWQPAFQQARMDWRQAAPMDQRGTDAWQQWRQAKPQRQSFF